ncbi:uncharacterized protein BXZ73DRAFT_95354 [Epithele typhae]|uniref:uncharacterized protein n=1 Tax=Epithele typhae TaxID=378194 RepID=UPI002007FB87|nr:uncharacterized protein BXZ73DRAFT_95354 [Epithele typhae]KAH9945833.1 hypothetical protein BXZ73DRAFT_95354 [Epithele typhae]
MDELSEEERVIDDQNIDIRNRGWNFLIPIGRTWTQHEEKNDADDASEGSDGSDRSGEGGSLMEEEENSQSSEEEEEEDLDADMEDLDRTADASGDMSEEMGSEEEGSDDEDAESEP